MTMTIPIVVGPEVPRERKGEKMTLNRLSDMHESTYQEEVKNKTYRGKRSCAKTMKGELAQLDALYPMKQVLSDSKKQMTHNRSAMNENTHREDMRVKTNREEGNCAKNVLLSALHHQRDRQIDTTGLTLMTRTCTKEIMMTTFATEGEEGHN